jgi:3-hydroxyacyl-CoA dehydrogenase
MSHLHYEVVDGIARIVFQNPPVNGLSHALRTGLVNALDTAEADPGVKAIVMTGSERAFSGGADISEFGTPRSGWQPTLRTVIEVLDAITKPVVAAIDGVCLGGGLELALGAHYRVAASRAKVGLPEVKLGLIPGAGGTQRLPRLLGLEKALDMIVSGAHIKASQLADTPLFDLVVDTPVVSAAEDFARELASKGAALKRVRDLSIVEADAQAFLQVARRNVAATSKHFPAPRLCLEAVAASVSLPFDEGMKREREYFLQLMQSEESQALRHVFAAERTATKVPGVSAETPRRDIRKVAVIGAGTMGGGISMNFLNAGIPVVLLEAKQDALDRGLATIRRNYENSAKKGRLTQEQVEERMGLLGTTMRYEDLADADLIIEAVFEEIGVKEQVFTALDAVAKPGAILASNTSTLDVNAIAAFTRRPEDVVGLHFFSPANVMKLREIVRGDKTSPEVLATSMDLAKRIGKKPVLSGVCDGFIGNRMLNSYRAAAEELLLQGASVAEIDQALEGFGLAMGPYRMGDLAGLDIGWAIRKRRQAERPDLDLSSVADRICEAGRFGQKTGAGWYRYEAGSRTPHEDPIVTKILSDYRAEKGISPRKFSPREIVERCVFALVNEGARILDEGIALRASDIDVVYLNGYGFPLHRGGPMHYAQQVGLFNVVRAIRRYASASEQAASFWQPASLLVQSVESGQALK